MDKFLYNTLNNYFKSLSIYGYKKDVVVQKLLILDYLRDLLNSDFKEYLSNGDILLTRNLIYKFYETTCEIDLPNIECTCISVEPPVPPIKDIITEFKLAPSNTLYEGTQDIIFTGLSCNINTSAIPLKEYSLKLYWGTDIWKSEQLVQNNITFTDPVSTTLIGGESYTSKISVLDTTGKEHFSDPFDITVRNTQTSYVYTGNTIAKPTIEEILDGARYNPQYQTQFQTPIMTLKTIWVVIPTDVTLVSMEGPFSGDYLYNIDTGKDLLTREEIILNGHTYYLYYLTTIRTNNSYKTIVR